jgi:hypothetical protein
MLLDPTSPLASEQRWLGEWFGGTPVGISAEPDGALLVSVPLEFSFDATMSTVKPPLAAVLARITSSLSRKPEAQIAIAAPADAGGPSELARERTVRIREHFYARGINLARIVELEDPGVPGVQLRLLPPPMR